MRFLFVLAGLMPLAAQTKSIPIQLYQNQNSNPANLRGIQLDKEDYVELKGLGLAINQALIFQEPNWIFGNERQLEIDPANAIARMNNQTRELLNIEDQGSFYVNARMIARLISETFSLHLLYEETSHSFHLTTGSEVLTIWARLTRKDNGYLLSFIYSATLPAPVISNKDGELRIKLRGNQQTLKLEGPEENHEALKEVRLLQESRELLILPGTLWKKFTPMPYTAQENRSQILIEGDFGKPAKNAPKKPRGITRIAIDPGHGGKDRGALGPTGLKEKDVTLEISRRLKSALLKLGYQIQMTRNDDTYLALKQRTAVANHFNADLLLSIHVNAVKLDNASGSETYYLSMGADTPETNPHYFDEDELDSGKESTEEDPAEDDLSLMLWDMAQTKHIEDSFRISRYVQKELNELAGIQSRGVKQAPLKVLKGATMPACLIEVAFISNPNEEDKLRNPDFLEKAVNAIRRAVQAYDSDVKKIKEPGALKEQNSIPAPAPSNESGEQ